MDYSFRIIDIRTTDKQINSSDSPKEGKKEKFRDKKKFILELIGKDQKGDKYHVFIPDFKPFMFVKAPDHWNNDILDEFLSHLQQELTPFYEKSLLISDCCIQKFGKLDGFDNNKKHNFIRLVFDNTPCYNKIRNLWYTDSEIDGKREFELSPDGYSFNGDRLYLYESNILPMLKFIHVKDIFPAGWITLPRKKTKKILNNTSCKYSLMISYNDIISNQDREDLVPLKISSLDCEMESRGDFPVAKKSYKKPATQFLEIFEKTESLTKAKINTLLPKMIYSIFMIDDEYSDRIDRVYLKTEFPTKEEVDEIVQIILTCRVKIGTKNKIIEKETMFEKIQADVDEEPTEEEENVENTEPEIKYTKKKHNQIIPDRYTIGDVIMNDEYDRETKMLAINTLLLEHFPEVEGDKITNIGTTLMIHGQEDAYLNYCGVLCETVDGVEHTCSQITQSRDRTGTNIIEVFKTEKEMLLGWRDFIRKHNPDYMTGWNTFVFDYDYMYCRAEECDCVEEFLKLSCINNEVCGTFDDKTQTYKIVEKIVSLASGDHIMHFPLIFGTIVMDMLNQTRKMENLASYALDNVAGHHICDWITDYQLIEYENRPATSLNTSNLTGLYIGSYVHLQEVANTTSNYISNDNSKFEVIDIDRINKIVVILGHHSPQFGLNKKQSLKWALAKDDVSYKDLQILNKGSADDRAMVAKYCIQDCNLVHYIINKTDFITGLIEKANVCLVPQSLIILRGQGIQLTSLVSNECRKMGVLMPVLPKGSKTDSYVGAVVLEPKVNIYMDTSTPVGDFNSLYPTSMISENISPDSLVHVHYYDMSNNLIKIIGETDDNGKFIYDNLPDYDYVDIKSITQIKVFNGTKAPKIVQTGYRVCRFAQYKNGRLAILPLILQKLLKKRKDTRALGAVCNVESMCKVYEQRQLSFKANANSVYGQTGAPTSTFYALDIAASTTAVGRMCLNYAKVLIETCYGNTEVNVKSGETIRTRAEYVYGDTDSVFFNFNLEYLDGTKIKGDRELELSIELAVIATSMVSKYLKAPHNFEYEKTFKPLCLLGCKSYVGIKYTHSLTKSVRTQMGVASVRRNYAQVVRDIYSGVMDALMVQKNIKYTCEYVDKYLERVSAGNITENHLLITKQLNSFYKNPKQIPHKVLADRQTARDPGNKFHSGDRIPFMYIVNPNKKALQGDKIETPLYIKEKKLQIDYGYYISGQIQKPLTKVFVLALEQIYVSYGMEVDLKNMNDAILRISRDYSDNEVVKLRKIQKLKENLVKEFIFDKHLRITNNRSNNNRTIIEMFSKQTETKEEPRAKKIYRIAKKPEPVEQVKPKFLGKKRAV